MRQTKAFSVTLGFLFVGYLFGSLQIPASAQGREHWWLDTKKMPAGVQVRMVQDGSVMLTAEAAMLAGDTKDRTSTGPAVGAVVAPQAQASNLDLMTLYTFAKDVPGRSNCNDECANDWLPLRAASDAMQVGEWTIVMRTDATKQWAFRGIPVYGFIKDAKPGDMKGRGVGNGAWNLARP